MEEGADIGRNKFAPIGLKISGLVYDGTRTLNPKFQVRLLIWGSFYDPLKFWDFRENCVFCHMVQLSGCGLEKDEKNTVWVVLCAESRGILRILNFSLLGP